MRLRTVDRQCARACFRDRFADTNRADIENPTQHQRPPSHHVDICVVANIQPAGNRLHAGGLHINRGRSAAHIQRQAGERD